MNTVCKCCFNTSSFLGNINFNKTCEDKPTSSVFKSSKILVPYFICRNCNFIFTDFMDNWNKSDFKKNIYNDDYILADPKENSQGEKTNSGYHYGNYFSNIILGLIKNKKISKSREEIKILDYGSGGSLSSFGRGLKANGFNLESYDPFFKENNVNNINQKFDFIFMIEVIEHCHELEKTCKNLSELLDDNGFLWIQTMLHEINTNNEEIFGGHHYFSAPRDKILHSWYIAPRNGHVSIFSFQSMKLLFQRYNFNLIKFEEEGILQNLVMAKKIGKGLN